MIVRYRRRAQDDISGIYERISKHSKQSAYRVLAAIKLAGKILARQPQIGVLVGHREARRWPMPHYDYAIFYVVDWENESVDVLRVMDGKRIRSLKRVPRQL